MSFSGNKPSWKIAIIMFQRRKTFTVYKKDVKIIPKNSTA